MQRTFTVVVSALACVSSSSILEAAIIPHWRQNTITPAAIAANPALGNAISMSLLVDLTGNSLFNVAGLDFTSIFPGVQYFNQATFGGDAKPNSAFFPFAPDLEFDTYVGTTLAFPSAPAIPGRLVGTGTAQVGTDGQFNVAWGATPNTGPLGGTDLEIARITFLGTTFLPPVPIPLSAGRVRDSVDPNVDVPIPAFPEPAAAPVLMAAVLLGRLRRS